MNRETIQRLSDRALAVLCAIETLGGSPSVDDLMQIRRKSQATIFRALAELYDAGIRTELSPPVRPRTKAKRTKAKRTIRRSYQKRPQEEGK